MCVWVCVCPYVIMMHQYIESPDLWDHTERKCEVSVTYIRGGNFLMGESHKGNGNGHIIDGTCEFYRMIASILEYAYVYINTYVYISRSSFPLHNDCTSVCCSVLQCVAVPGAQPGRQKRPLQHTSLCCSILQYAAVCCSVLFSKFPRIPRGSWE